MEGINLLVDLNPRELRKRIRSQTYEEVVNSDASKFADFSAFFEGQRQALEEYGDEVQSTMMEGKRLGVDIMGGDELLIKKDD